MMTRMATPPKIVRSERHNTNGTANPIICKPVVEERSVTTIVLDHKQTDKKTCRGDHQQQTNPIAVMKRHPHHSPDDNEGNRRDRQLEYTARAIRFAIAVKKAPQCAGVL